MAKLGVLKRTVALVAAIALVMCFAVSVSAAPNINTTTQYIDGSTTDVRVSVSVTEIDTEAEYVTYYATSPSPDEENIVYLDQKEVVNGSATFEYQTTATNLGGVVKVGYTGATSGEDVGQGDIPSNSVSVKDKAHIVPVKIPTEEETATITLDYECEEGNTVANVTATGATVGAYDYNRSTNKLTVSLSAISGSVVLTVTEKVYIGGTPEADLLDAAAIVVKEGFRKDTLEDRETVVDDANADKAGDRKLTVIAKVTNAEKFGIIVSKNEITTTGQMSKAAFNAAFSEDVIYIAQGKNNEGVFAVQLIDTSESTAESMVITGQEYYTAVYAANSDGTYVVDKKDSFIKASAE